MIDFVNISEAERLQFAVASVLEVEGRLIAQGFIEKNCAVRHALIDEGVRRDGKALKAKRKLPETSAQDER